MQVSDHRCVRYTDLRVLHCSSAMAQGDSSKHDTGDGRVFFTYNSSAPSLGWALSAVALDSLGNLFVADPYTSNQILQIKPLNAVTARFTFSTLGLSLNLPLGVAVDRQHRVYIADSFNDRILRVNPSPSYATTVVYQGRSVIFDIALTSR